MNDTSNISPAETGTSDRERLEQFLRTLAPERFVEIRDDTVIVGPGGLESMALLRLYQWLERENKAPIDITAVDVANEWRDVNAVLEFIARTRVGDDGC